MSETHVEEAKAAHLALIEKLRSVQKTVVGEFTPATAGLALAQDSILLSGGPFDGQETKVPRGAALHERPAAGTDGFWPARYFRTKQRTEAGLQIFKFQPGAPDETAAA
jgi:hypothetical protein